MKALLIGVVLALLTAWPAFADVTIKSTVKGGGAMPEGQSVQYIKGTKMRADTTVNNHTTVTIIDVGAKQVILMDPATKQARVIELSGQPAAQGGEAAQAQVSLTPTGETKQMLGRTCTEYTLAMTFPATMGPNTMTVTMSGPTWIAKDAPGTSDFDAFYKAATESGVFAALTRGAGRGAAGNPGLNERGMVEMYKALARTGGLPYEQQLTVRIEGAPAMPQMPPGGMTTTMTVTAVSTEPIADTMFTVPTDYRTVK